MTSLNSEEGIDDYLNTIKRNLLAKEDTISYLRKELKKAQDAAYASEEMAKMKAQLEEIKSDYYRGFPVTEAELNKVRKWQREHDSTIHANPQGYHGVSGGGYSYVFYPTVIGTSGACVCNSCRRLAYQAAFAEGKYDRDAYYNYMKQNKGECEFQELG